MARRLGSKQNTLVIEDKISGSDLHLHYRMPTTEEIINYRNSANVREGDEMVNKLPEIRIQFGADILTGFRLGDFEKIVDGDWVAFSSDPGHKDYDEGWKEQVVDGSADVVELLAMHVFEFGCSRKKTKQQKPQKKSGEDPGGN